MHHMLGMSYEPKKEAVRVGLCRQTIRRIYCDVTEVPGINGIELQFSKRTKQVGDGLTIFAWSGVPRHSTWAWSFKAQIVEAPVLRFKYDEWGMFNGQRFMRLTDGEMDELARRDFIEEPTKEGLEAVLKGLHHGDIEGTYWNAVRW